MTQPVRDIAPADALRAAEAGEVHLIDVREDDEWAAGHASLASHTPLGALDPAAVPTDRPLVTVCRSGARSGKAAQALADAGRDVQNMTGGMNDWSAAGLPVVREDGSAGEVI